MSAKDKPVSRPANEKFISTYDRIFNSSPKMEAIGEDARPKDRVKRGLSSACVEEDWDCTKKGGGV